MAGDLGEALRDRGIPEPLALDAVSLVAENALSVLLYGSYARGDALTDSDLDILVLADGPAGSRSTGTVSVSVYTRTQLKSAAGTIFGMHLARDGIVLLDTNGELAALLASMAEPDPEEVFDRIRHVAAILDDDPPDAHLRGRVRLARYLLRTAVYAAALAEGRPCFSVRDLAARAGDPGLVDVLTSRPGSNARPTAATLEDLHRRLVAVTGETARNPHGSLRNMIVAEWYEDRPRSSLGALALADETPDFDYTALAKVLL